jgi:beta-galactosidase/beta-glucuronidase
MRVIVSSLSILAAAAVSSSSSSRIVVPIDLGWRTAPYQSNANCSFPNPSTCQVGQLLFVPSATNAVTCAAAACAGHVATWQFEASQGCWIGNSNTCAYPLGTWAGASMKNVGPGPDPNAPEAQPNFNDAAWRILDTPHDATVEGNYSQAADGGEGFLPATIVWYRKHIAIPAGWAGQAITLTVDASLSTSTFWLNGKMLVSARPSGYLPLHLRLDGANGLIIGGNNVFVAYVDGSETTGWWYEGSGLLRHARLTVTPPDAYIAPSGVSSPAYISGAITPHNAADTSTGLFADVVLTPSVDILYLNPIKVTASFRLIAADGITVVATSSLAGSKSTLQPPSMTIQDAELWSVPRPYLYTLETTLTAGAIDAVNISVGLRGITFDAERGMFVNEQHVKMRGFCNHESFTGVGGAIPDRVDLLRIQQMRGVGGNA